MNNNFTRSSGIMSQLKDMYIEQIVVSQPKDDGSSDSDSDSSDAAVDYEDASPSDYKIQTKMSNNLKKLIGMQLDDSDDHVNAACGIFSFWMAPDTSGLKNSEPIIRTGKNEYKPEYKTSVSGMRRASINVESNNQSYNNTDTDTEDDNNYASDNDYDDEEDTEGGDESNTFLPSGPMSASLMKALGLLPEDAPEVVTDWKPPAQCGLAHSKRKIII